MIVKALVFTLTWVALWCLVDTNATLLHIIPSSSNPCPVELCLTLSQFAANTSHYLDSNTTLILQPGNHDLKTELVVANVTEFLIVSNYTIPVKGKVAITQSSRFHIVNVTKVYVQAVTFIGFGKNKVKSVDNFTIEHSSFIGRKYGNSHGICYTGHRHNYFGTALELVETNATIVNSSFISNQYGNYRESFGLAKYFHIPHQSAFVGGAMIVTKSNATIIGSYFKSNCAKNGGAIFGEWCSNIAIIGSTFVDNSAMYSSNYKFSNNFGGALYLECDQNTQNSSGSLTINGSKFYHNKGYGHYYKGQGFGYGGALVLYQVSTGISGSDFNDNVATSNGGAIFAANPTRAMIINGSGFSSNKAFDGGAIFTKNSSKVIIDHCNFSSNVVKKFGGATLFDGNAHIQIHGCHYSNNQADAIAGAIWVVSADFLNISESQFMDNKNQCHDCKYSATINLAYVTTAVLNILFANNKAPLLILDSKVTFTGATKFLNNTEFTALRAIMSEVTINGTCVMMHNFGAAVGGAMIAANSKVYIHGSTTIANNTARLSGGGLYLYQSEVICKANSSLELLGNSASEKGGGVHAISSTIKVDNIQFDSVSNVTFIENRAKYGGGICLEMNSKLYIIQFELQITNTSFMFVSNLADYGGAAYVADETNFWSCAKNTDSSLNECFMQVLATSWDGTEDYNHITTYFSTNHANKSGSIIFGGLLDRCSVNQYAPFKSKLSGVTYLKQVTNIENEDSISSLPVQVCFCSNGLKNCSYQLPPIRVMKGQNFTIPLVAIDQANHTINATIRSSLSSNIGGLGVNQVNQSIGETCTNLTFSIMTTMESEELILYAAGPCKDADPSRKTVDIEFIPCSCPIGFQPKSDNTKCDCECDSNLHPYITECNYQNKTLVREGTYWITHIYNTSGYLIYPYCPLDYCKPPTSRVNISFDTPNDTNLQCADHRSGTLCGTCQSGFSLSLGSSKCIRCSTNWYRTLAAVLSASLLAGVLLVVILLVLNLTVAVGTLNGIIFYANVMGANSSIFFPYSTQTFLTVFLDWLNLEIGFDCCFYSGMDAYWKTILQLAFPVYLIFLVVMVIILCEHSSKFARLIGRRNPIATLTTLVLLSYTKLLRTIIAALSFAILNYPDGTSKVVWLPDPTLEYLKGKHIALFVTAILILLPGVAFTLILFFWQWLLHHQNKTIFKWVSYNKLQLFLEPYHAPYKFSHRYWTGLLLLVRVTLYIIISVLNVSNNPGVNILAIGISMLCLLLLKTYHGDINGQVYRQWSVNVLETICYTNMALFCLSRLFVLESSDEKGQKIVAYISGSITFALFVAVLAYHLFTELMSKPVTWLWRKVETRWKKPDNNINDYNDNILDNDQAVPCEPTASEIARPPQGELPLSALVQAGMMREPVVKTSSYGTLTTDLRLKSQLRTTKAKQMPLSSDESADSSTPLLNENE